MIQSNVILIESVAQGAAKCRPCGTVLRERHHAGECRYPLTFGIAGQARNDATNN